MAARQLHRRDELRLRLKYQEYADPAVRVASEPLDAVAEGTGRVAQHSFRSC
jgi:hypothetical protein